MIEVEKRTFVTKIQYENILSKLRSENIELKESNQITYYFSGDSDFRIMFTNEFIKLWLKKGMIHDDAREEYEVKVDNKYKEPLLKMLSALGYEIEIKWFRKRIEGKYNDFDITIDYSAGYGYIIEIEKLIAEESLVEEVKKRIEELLKIFSPIISSKEEFDNKYQDYKINFKEYTKDVNEDEFLNN